MHIKPEKGRFNTKLNKQKKLKDIQRQSSQGCAGLTSDGCVHHTDAVRTVSHQRSDLSCVVNLYQRENTLQGPDEIGLTRSHLVHKNLNQT